MSDGCVSIFCIGLSPFLLLFLEKWLLGERVLPLHAPRPALSYQHLRTCCYLLPPMHSVPARFHDAVIGRITTKRRNLMLSPLIVSLPALLNHAPELRRRRAVEG